MRHINKMFEAYTAEQVKSVQDKINELRERYLNTEEAQTAEHLMYEVFDITHTAKPRPSIFWTDEPVDDYLPLNTGGHGYLTLDLDQSIDGASDVSSVAESVDKRILSLSKVDKADLAITYDMLVRGQNWPTAHKLTSEELVMIIERVAGIEEMGGVAAVFLDSYFSRPIASSHRSTPTKVMLRSDSKDYQKWIKFIAKQGNSWRSSINLRRIEFIFKVDVDISLGDYEGMVPKSIISDFQKFCDDHKLGIESRKRLAGIVAGAKGG